MFRLNQVCEIHTEFKSQVIKGMSIDCLLFGTLPLGILPDPWENDHNFCPWSISLSLSALGYAQIETSTSPLRANPGDLTIRAQKIVKWPGFAQTGEGDIKVSS